MYVRHFLAGKPLHTSHGDDTSQLGGDFIVDRKGILRLIYRSHDPTDRPSGLYLVEHLRKLKG